MSTILTNFNKKGFKTGTGKIISSGLNEYEVQFSVTSEFRPEDLRSAGVVDGGSFGTWNSYRGGNIVATQPTATKQLILRDGIINGFPVVEVDGLARPGQEMALNVPINGKTIIVVLGFTVNSWGGGVIFGPYSNVNVNNHYRGNHNLGWAETTTDPNNNPTLRIRRNGVLGWNKDILIPPFQIVTLYNTNFFYNQIIRNTSSSKGYIAYLKSFSRYLTISEMQREELKLKEKFRL